jgi:uncharacterized NAD(P)/FAD-binding protein YdhS
MENTRVGIIGCGPRGLSVLERIIRRFVRLNTNQSRLSLYIFEPNRLGEGVYSDQLPEYLLLNTECQQIDLFGEKYLNQIDDSNGSNLNFYQWLLQNHRTINDYGSLRNIKPEDFVPRKWLGDYLNWVFQKIVTEVPDNIEIHISHQEVIDVTKQGNNEMIILQDGTTVITDYVFLTIGHAQQVMFVEKSMTSFQASDVLPAFPHQSVNRIVKPDQRVALLGMGLTSIDVISYLTVGRGGVFRRNSNGELRYDPSGNEPVIIQCSRSGLPYLARPWKIADNAGSYSPQFLTNETVDRIKKTKGKIDFRQDLLPLIWKEMKYNFYRKTADLTEQEFWDRYNQDGFLGLEREYGSFNPEEIVCSPLGRVVDSDEYQTKFTQLLLEDIRHSADEFEQPIKSSIEMFRVLREQIRRAVDFDGLTDESQVDFRNNILPFIYRSVVGPPVQKLEELVALIKQGIVQHTVGPDPLVEFNNQQNKWVIQSTVFEQPVSFEVDYVISGHVQGDLVSKPHSELLQNLMDRERITPYKLRDGASAGIEINDRFHPINQTQGIESRIYALGLITDGKRNFNLYIPSPKSRSQAFRDADLCVMEIAQNFGWQYSEPMGSGRK